MKKKKIVYFTDSITYGGAEKYIKIFALHIDKTKFNINVVLPKRKATEDFVNELLDDEIQVDFVESRHANYKKNILNSLAYFLKTKPDIIHFNLPFYTNCKYAILASLIYKFFFHKTKLILTEHNVQMNKTATWKGKTFRKFYFDKFDRVIVVSNMSKNILIKMHHMPPKKIIVIYNGIDIEKFSSYDSSTIETYRKKYLIFENHLVFGVIGRIAEIKGHRYFIEASKKVSEKYPMCKFLIVGEGDKELTQNLKNQVDSMGLSNYFIFTGYQKNIAELLEMIDIFVLPSLSEGLPFSILEAMAMKKPVISTNVGGIPELIINRNRGILVSPKDSKELANAMLELAENYTNRIYYGLNGFKHVTDNFSQKNMLVKTQDIYS